MKAILDGSHSDPGQRSHATMARKELYDSGAVRTFADLVGRRLVFSIGLVLFAFTSLLCALSPSSLFLILALNRPFTGSVAITPESYERNVQTYRTIDAIVADARDPSPP